MDPPPIAHMPTLPAIQKSHMSFGVDQSGRQGEPSSKRAKTEEPTTRELSLNHLSSWQEPVGRYIDERAANPHTNPMAAKWPDYNFLNPDEAVAGSILLNDSKASGRKHELDAGCVRANACKDIYWDPKDDMTAAIVTCGGLCPGLNSIIHNITHCLWHQYGVRKILGVTAGYNGLADMDAYPPIELTNANTREIHMKGGSILKAGRGGFDAPKICETLAARKIQMLFVVGGDGTQYAGHLLAEEARSRGLSCSIVGVPKSIDNDVLFFDKTFGFDSAVSAACSVIRNGLVEATSCAKACSVVKLMGRDAGFVACHAALASDVVDLCLIPEVPFQLDDVLAHVDATIARKGHMVIAVAEGAGQEHVSTGKLDATGHTIYGDIGVFIRDLVNKHLKQQGGRSFYIDPSYIIRSVPIEPNDHIYCARLSHNAVHTAFRGYTGVCVGARHNVIVMLPSKLVASGKKRIKVNSSTWQTCVQSCNMPRSLSGLGKAGAPPDASPYPVEK